MGPRFMWVLSYLFDVNLTLLIPEPRNVIGSLAASVTVPSYDMCMRVQPSGKTGAALLGHLFP